MEACVDKMEALALQVAKEIVVKFVETGRISPGNFAEHFGPIFEEVLRVINRGGVTPATKDEADRV